MALAKLSLATAGAGTLFTLSLSTCVQPGVDHLCLLPFLQAQHMAYVLDCVRPLPLDTHGNSIVVCLSPELPVVMLRCYLPGTGTR